MQVSLQALKAFESAARLGSFKLAAEELALTPTAISHHIGNLESRLNIDLFHRQGRRVSLTETGRQLASATSDGFRRIERALDDVIMAGSAIRVTTTSSLAAMVLIPAQHEFEQANLGISLDISTGERVDGQSYLIPLRFGHTASAEKSDIICYESFNVFGAYSTVPPSWSEEPVSIFTTEWKNKSLPEPPFNSWLIKNGLDGTNVKFKKFDQELFGIQQAIAGKGLVFCSTTLARKMVELNLLRELRAQPVVSELCYYVPAKNSFETRGAVRFLEWIENLLNQ